MKIDQKYDEDRKRAKLQPEIRERRASEDWHLHSRIRYCKDTQEYQRLPRDFRFLSFRLFFGHDGSATEPLNAASPDTIEEICLEKKMGCTSSAVPDGPTMTATSGGPQSESNRLEQHGLFVGDRVVLTGLVNQADMNGRVGYYVRPANAGRYEVCVEDARVVSINRRNLVAKPVCCNDRVRLHSLHRTDMNGLKGIATSTTENGRWIVILDDGSTVACLSEKLAGVVDLAETVEGAAVVAGESIPLLAGAPSDPSRTQAQPDTGVDTALGDVFSSNGVSNKGRDRLVATAVAPASS